MQLNENEKRTVDDERSLGELPKTASEEKESLLYLLNDNDSDADIGITSSTSGPKLLSQPWKCYDKSIMHQQKFRMMEEYGQKYPRKVKLVNGVKVICSEEFLLGKGSDGTRVYLGLGTDGYGKAVKRLLRG
ncbi:uncharacterized protein LOC124439467 [Xenia sp. Carnegie-2017]|uniref:uncharacterized protein LOC124439467 n=1 Tax=Xenia sp. Carnegie-2017 TaxID=2897299 RepID=UPI001F045077|nr:uncharacterized protein LOC124439467 [Xenia sp. Carnegie-2017]